jgi:hypothetical protein
MESKTTPCTTWRSGKAWSKIAAQVRPVTQGGQQGLSSTHTARLLARLTDPDAQKHDIDWQLHFARPLEGQLLGERLSGFAQEAVSRQASSMQASMQESMQASKLGCPPALHESAGRQGAVLHGLLASGNGDVCDASRSRSRLYRLAAAGTARLRRSARRARSWATPPWATCCAARSSRRWPARG